MIVAYVSSVSPFEVAPKGAATGQAPSRVWGSTAGLVVGDEVRCEVVDTQLEVFTFGDITARGARAYMSAASQSIDTATFTAVALAAESFDTDTLHDNATNNTRIVLDKVGYWDLTGAVAFETNGTGDRQAHIRLNGTTYWASPKQVASASDQVIVLVAATVPTTAVTDYAELIAWHSKGSAMNVVGGAANVTWLAAMFRGV